MPTYDYKCIYKECQSLETVTRLVPAEERDTQKCSNCNNTLTRKFTFEGSVWAPTAGGMR